MSSYCKRSSRTQLGQQYKAGHTWIRPCFTSLKLEQLTTKILKQNFNSHKRISWGSHNTRKGARLRSPSLVMASAFTFYNLIWLFWIFDAVSSDKSCPTSMLFLLTYIEFRTVESFPPTENADWSIQISGAPLSRMQGSSSANNC